MLNIYKYHTHPESLPLYEKAMECIPDLFWEKYKDNPEELKKRERAISMSAKYSYFYALNVLKTRFEAGEKSIATDAWCSYRYASDVLNGRFEAGEETIATDAWSSYFYARYLLKGRFEAGEKAILNSEYKQNYLDFLKEKGIKINA